ncbi:phosphoenolpyruvate synthase [Pontibacter ummariensis]|uniref:Phosphoenolpyruvate synthase n=1 Tax=Pontibacter ummariensis TaxID=1610492 RepID=A0A239K066_9BACT|nr:phosphoenolpyruvate synthase [Pontibacter ummariensis]PRY07286.1 phosphoenolpyruvate synthase [Pontibacter ummariensis]SNT10434.1 phosphoenolpyruvate synthase [Pontibacter ummariensis]
MATYIIPLKELTLQHVSEVGGKNASLGEMLRSLAADQIRVPDGFATTARAYQDFLESNNLTAKIEQQLAKLDTQQFSNLQETGAQIRKLILAAHLPDSLAGAIREAYQQMCRPYKAPVQVAVRSSATAEDLPDASFAGQHESYLNISGEEQVLKACLRCYASLFTDRAIKYRHDHGFDHMKVYLSAGVQKMVRSDLASAGVCFTLDPQSGFDQVVFLTGSWGLGENVVQGTVNPDEFYVFKPTLKQGKKAIISKKVGSKAITMVYADGNSDQPTVNIATPAAKQEAYVLSDDEIRQVAEWAVRIEEHYGRPMDIEWAKDGETGELFIVQARPETIHSRKNRQLTHTTFTLQEAAKPLASGKAIGQRIISGTARLLNSPQESHLLQAGEILVTDITNPDWDPILKKVSAVITNKGGRTSHAAIVARELGALAVVGTGNATELIRNGQEITVSCADGQNGMVYDGKLNWREEVLDFGHLTKPNTRAMLIVGDPDQAFDLSYYPNDGVGLMRLEFIINNSIQIHPMALVKYHELQEEAVKAQIDALTHHHENKEDYFVEKLAQSVATIAAAFYPKDVVVRMSDFKTNEYANLIGGRQFEPKEENPMLGFRGASRYYNPRYREGFGLECKAMKVVRDEMGLTNVKLMIPFCRTIAEGQQVLKQMAKYGLVRGENGLEVYVMAEIPSNVLLAKEFARIFDGFSIGSNDLTQLTLGIDRDSSTVSELFDEQNEAVQKMISEVIRAAHETGVKVGLCGQAPSDFPAFAQFLVEQGIDSISFNPDALLKGVENILAAEKEQGKAGREAVGPTKESVFPWEVHS